MRGAREDFHRAVRFIEPKTVPVVIYDVAPFVSSFCGIPAKQYYLDGEAKLTAQIRLQDEFPDALCIPGIWADFGAAAETSALGCAVVWPENDAPFVRPAIEKIEDVEKLRSPNPEGDGLLPVALKQYELMWTKLDPWYVDQYGFLDGLGYSIGPLEIGAITLGYETFFLGFFSHPLLVHKLLEITTETVLAWLEAQQKINGDLKHLVIADHVPSLVSRDHFSEFCLPYLKTVFRYFPRPLKLWHNEGPVNHILDLIPEVGMDYFHCGKVNLREARSQLNQKVALMGNVDPINILLNGTPADVVKACEACLRLVAGNGGFILSSGGGMAPGTPRRNIRAMIESVKKPIEE